MHAGGSRKWCTYAIYDRANTTHPIHTLGIPVHAAMGIPAPDILTLGAPVHTMREVGIPPPAVGIPVHSSLAVGTPAQSLCVMDTPVCTTFTLGIPVHAMGTPCIWHVWWVPQCIPHCGGYPSTCCGYPGTPQLFHWVFQCMQWVCQASQHVQWISLCACQMQGVSQ